MCGGEMEEEEAEEEAEVEGEGEVTEGRHDGRW